MTLQQSQYNCIGIVAKHCDSSKLCIAEDEASRFDLSELFCDFWIDILDIIKEVEDYGKYPKPPLPEHYAEKKELLEGGTYLDCKGKNRPFEGVYSIMAYYSYSRYIILNGFSDTPNGLVQKTNEFSIPKSLKELESFADKYRNMGRISFDRTVKYICSKKDIFDFSDCPKTECGCDSCGCGGTKAKGYGFKSSNVNK